MPFLTTRQDEGGEIMSLRNTLLAVGMIVVFAVGVLIGNVFADNNGEASPTPPAEHEEEADHDDADGTAEANAYLEAAPKGTLYLVEMTSFSFKPDILEANAGEVLEIAIQNVEPVLHDLTIDKIDADVHISYLGGTGEHAHREPGKESDVHFALTEPGTGVVHLKVNEPGEYVFYCSVPGHREAGMEGKLIVR